MKVILLDASRFTSKADAHEYIAKKLCFPEHYGKNLDALADCLSELSRDTGIVIAHTEKMCDYAEAVVETFTDTLKKSGRIFIV